MDTHIPFSKGAVLTGQRSVTVEEPSLSSRQRRTRDTTRAVIQEARPWLRLTQLSEDNPVRMAAQMWRRPFPLLQHPDKVTTASDRHPAPSARGERLDRWLRRVMDKQLKGRPRDTPVHLLVHVSISLEEKASIIGFDHLQQFHDVLVAKVRAAYGRNRPVEIIMEPTDELSSGEVLVMAGPAIFAPSPHQQPRQTVEVVFERRGVREPAIKPVWSMLSNAEAEAAGVRDKPAGLYDGQTLLVLGGSIRESVVNVPGWPWRDGLACLNVKSRRCFGDGVILQADDDRMPVPDSDGVTEMRFHRVATPGHVPPDEAVIVRLLPVEPARPRPRVTPEPAPTPKEVMTPREPVWGGRSPLQPPRSLGSILDTVDRAMNNQSISSGPPIAADTDSRLVVVGALLPRLRNGEQLPESFSIYPGKLLGRRDCMAKLCLSGCCGEDQVKRQNNPAEDFLPIQPGEGPLGEGLPPLLPAPTAISHVCLAWIPLEGTKAERVLYLSNGSDQTVGRYDETPEECPDRGLSLLGHEVATVAFAAGEPVGLDLFRMHRRHLRATPSADGLKLALMLAATAPVHVLSEDRSTLLATLAPNGTREVIMKPGTYLAIGPYLLQYRADGDRTIR
ncbi:hypothetical protein [Niveispirillum sp.]|uniref:hypothetical protein n=1 Tax=Niveispirillum sp. TaxID=1917217 RepID=UPI001B685ADB|nr:hypothetical protein [Niveispirillum sp.]MBP7335875.1 hypothetical protein [Niveispirillum sp.]